MRTMNVSLPDALGDYVQNLVAEQRYSSASEVVREGLRLLQERHAALRLLRSEIQEGVAELDRGEGSSLKEVTARIRARRTRKAKAVR
jgi:antitoxin ParD1/3/4